MFNKFYSIIIQFIIGLTVFEMNFCLNITEMNVQSIVWSPQPTTLTCDRQGDNENDTFVDIRWYKLVDNHWKLIKIFPQPLQAPLRAGTPEMKGEEGEEGEGGGEEAPKEETPTDAPKEEEETPKEEPTQEPAKEVTETKPEEKPTEKPTEKEPELYSLTGMTATDDSNIELSQTSQSSAGLYKCILKSTKEKREETKEMRVFFKPEAESKPVLTLTKLQDNHISVKCEAPVSYPMTALNFFINYEPAPHEDVHRLPAIKTKNTTYGTNDELVINVEELRFRATKESVLNGNILIACSATFVGFHHTFDQLDIPFNGTLYSHKCLTAPIVIVIVVVVLIVIIVIIAIVWLFLRKKKLNSLNKVSELFNKQKTITVLVDNNTNDMKIE